MERGRGNSKYDFGSYLGPFITITNSNDFAIKRDINGKIEIFPVPGIAEIIFW
jgi:hypothetical protein